MVVFGVVLALGALLADLVTSESSAATLSVHASHGSGAVVVAHSPNAIALALLGPPIVLAGLSLMHLQSLRSAKVLSLVAGLTLLYADGLVHWLAVLEHLGEPLYAAFFIVGGAVQVGAVLLVRRHERALWWLGVALTVFFIELYVLVLVVPAPFSVEPESLTSLGTLSKGFELALLASLGIFYGPRMVPTRLRIAVVHGPSLALLFLGALASLITIDLERYWYWWPRLVFLPDTVLVVSVSNTVFVFTLLLVTGLVAFATLAYYLRTGLLVGLTWSMAAMITILHGLYAVYYAGAALTFPLLLCIVSGVLLPASILKYNAKFLLAKLGLSINIVFTFGRLRLTHYWKQTPTESPARHRKGAV